MKRKYKFLLFPIFIIIALFAGIFLYVFLYNIAIIGPKIEISALVIDSLSEDPVRSAIVELEIHTYGPLKWPPDADAFELFFLKLSPHFHKKKTNKDGLALFRIPPRAFYNCFAISIKASADGYVEASKSFGKNERELKVELIPKSKNRD